MDHVLVALKDVTIRYPDLSTFEHIHLEVETGKHLAFAGNNERLKNALIDALAGNVAVVNGEKRFPFLEHLINARQAPQGFSAQKMVALVSGRHSFKNLSNTNDFYYQQRFNSADSENSLTVRQYLQTISSSGLNDHWTLENTIERLNLYPLLDEGVIKLSNGETRKVLIAAALLRNPMLLLLHYPFAGLDEKSRTMLSELIDQISAFVTIVLTTRPNEIPASVKHVAIVDDYEPLRVVRRSEYQSKSIASRAVPINEQEIVSLIGRERPPCKIIASLRNVHIRYDDKTILDNINWTILQGERWSLTGPNGAGKSTLLSLINGDNPQAFANDIVLFDRKKGSGESIWEIKQKIGFFSPELYQYFPAEALAVHAVESGFFDTIGLFRPSQPATHDLALRWMKIFGVGDKANKRLGNLSAIEQRKCLLARAMVKNPALLILDEPCQGFDERDKEFFKTLINIVCRHTNTTLIYVSHYPDEIPSCVDKHFRLSHGRQLP